MADYVINECLTEKMNLPNLKNAMLFFKNMLIQHCGSSISCVADHVINECLTEKMNS